MVWEQRKAVNPGVVGLGPSGVLDVPDIPEGCLVHDAVHLLQTLCLADPFQAHLWGPMKQIGCL